jgi:hypothetical protein
METCFVTFYAENGTERAREKEAELAGCAPCEMNIASAATPTQLKLISLLFLLGAGHADIGAKGRVSSQ